MILPLRLPILSAWLVATAGAVFAGADSAAAVTVGTGKSSAMAAPRIPATLDRPADTVNQALAIFAGGPFWALEAAFEGRPGVVEAVAGYTGGKVAPGSYAEVVEGGTGHCLAVAVLYDKRRTRFGNLVDIYWRAIDPTARNRQFSDTGAEFRTVIFWKDSAQKAAAEASLRKPPRPFGGGPLPGPVTVAVEKAMPFYPAEPAHQDYHRKYPGRYRMWLRVSGREEGLQSIWGGGAGGGAGAHSSRSRRASQ